MTADIEHSNGDQPAAAAAAPPGPVLVHAGVYALYETPNGGRHLVYRPDGAEADIHVPDIPAEALPLVQSFLNNGLPPQVLNLLQGRLSPMRVLAMLRGVAGDGGGELEDQADGGGELEGAPGAG